jgi:hypothetical protein
VFKTRKKTFSHVQKKYPLIICAATTVYINILLFTAGILICAMRSKNLSIRLEYARSLGSVAGLVKKRPPQPKLLLPELVAQYAPPFFSKNFTNKNGVC